MRFFLSLLACVPKPARMLDIGGTYEFWREAGPLLDRDRVQVHLLNLFPRPSVPEPFSSLVGDARDLSIYPDQAFDIVFSSSVLAFVGAPADQRRMAHEIRRVGVRYFVQTPNRNFPVDWRTLVPFFHWLPAACQAWCFRHFRVGRYSRVQTTAHARSLATRVQDLTASQVRCLFPDATLTRERFLGLTKSFMIHKGFTEPE